MLIKLIKYENMAIKRILIPVYISVLLVAACNRISLDFCESDSVIIVVFDIIFSVVCIAALVMFFITCIKSFVSNLVGTEGYLMFMLPVASYKLIVSKLIITILWGIAGIADFLLALLIISLNKASGLTFNLLIKSLEFEIKNMSNEIKAVGQNPDFVLTMIFVLLFTYIIFLIMHIYTSIAIGTQFNNHKIIAGLGYYFIYNVVMNIAAFIFAFLIFEVPMEYSLSEYYIIIDKSGEEIITTSSSYSPNILWIIIVASLLYVLSFIFEFILINNLFKKRLNLQ